MEPFFVLMKNQLMQLVYCDHNNTLTSPGLFYLANQTRSISVLELLLVVVKIK